MGGGDDDGEPSLVLHAGEQEGTRAGHAEPVLTAHGLSCPLARDGLAGMGLVERADGHEAAGAARALARVEGRDGLFIC